MAYEPHHADSLRATPYRQPKSRTTPTIYEQRHVNSLQATPRNANSLQDADSLQATQHRDDCLRDAGSL